MSWMHRHLSCPILVRPTSRLFVPDHTFYHTCITMAFVSAARSFDLLSSLAAKHLESRMQMSGTLRQFFFENLGAWLSGFELRETTKYHSEKTRFYLKVSSNSEWWVNVSHGKAIRTYGEVTGTPLRLRITSLYPEFLEEVQKVSSDAGYTTEILDATTLSVTNPHADSTELCVFVEDGCFDLQ